MTNEFEIDIVIMILIYGIFLGIYLGRVLIVVKDIANSLEDIARALMFRDDKDDEEVTEQNNGT